MLEKPGVVSTDDTRVSAPSPRTGTARNAASCSRKPGVPTLARLFVVTASWSIALRAPAIAVNTIRSIISGPG